MSLLFLTARSVCSRCASTVLLLLLLLLLLLQLIHSYVSTHYLWRDIISRIIPNNILNTMFSNVFRRAARIIVNKRLLDISRLRKAKRRLLTSLSSIVMRVKQLSRGDDLFPDTGSSHFASSLFADTGSSHFASSPFPDTGSSHSSASLSLLFKNRKMTISCLFFFLGLWSVAHDGKGAADVELVESKHPDEVADEYEVPHMT